MKNQKGFTLIELLVVIAVIGIIASIVYTNLAGGDKEAIESSMVVYVKTLYPELVDVRVTCSNKDSDQNGYYRCTATGTNRQEKRETVVAECDDDNNCVPIQGVDR